jgi:hypothetical protein
VSVSNAPLLKLKKLCMQLILNPKRESSKARDLKKCSRRNRYACCSGKKGLRKKRIRSEGVSMKLGILLLKMHKCGKISSGHCRCRVHTNTHLNRRERNSSSWASYANTNALRHD